MNNQQKVKEDLAYIGMSNGFKKPEHYSKGIDTFERMEKNCDLKERMAFIRGSIDAYLWREKGQDKQDFEKIINYSLWALKQLG